MEAADALGTRIMDMKPSTLAGFAVQAQFIAFAIAPTRDEAEADMDWDKLIILRLADNIAALAAGACGA